MIIVARLRWFRGSFIAFDGISPSCASLISATSVFWVDSAAILECQRHGFSAGVVNFCAGARRNPPRSSIDGVLRKKEMLTVPPAQAQRNALATTRREQVVSPRSPAERLLRRSFQERKR